VDQGVQQQIVERVRCGQQIDEIEAELAPTVNEGEDERAAIWLYAWVAHERRGRRIGRDTPVLDD